MTSRSWLNDHHYAFDLTWFWIRSFHAIKESGRIKLVHQSVHMLKGDLMRTLYSSVLSYWSPVSFQKRDPDGGSGGQVISEDNQAKIDEPQHESIIKCKDKCVLRSKILEKMSSTKSFFRLEWLLLFSKR
jgi:hypothetical protein